MRHNNQQRKQRMLSTYTPALPPEFQSGNEIPVERATITRERMTEILTEAIEAYQRQQWISLDDRLPVSGVLVMVYTPPQPGDYPDDIRISFDYIDPDSDGDTWYYHDEHYEHFCCVGKGGDGIEWRGPSEKAPYTYWQPLPPLPTESTA